MKIPKICFLTLSGNCRLGNCCANPMPDAAILLIRRALAAGIHADYVLMDTWFTTEPMLEKLLETGIDAIGMGFIYGSFFTAF